MHGWKKHKNGFTIVELIVVIVVIAILASIVITVYSGVRGNSYDTAVMSDLRNLAAKIKVFESDNNTAPLSTELGSLKWEANRSVYTTNGTTATYNITYCYSAATSSNNRYWAVLAMSKSGKIFYTTQAIEPKEYTNATKPSFNNSDAQTACSTLTSQVTSQAYTSNYSGWYATDTTTGPWRNWTIVNPY